MKKYHIILLAIILTIGVVLDRCTSVNITTASIFKKSAYDNFKYLKQGVTSANYEIVRLSHTAYPILYDTINNNFYINGAAGISKIDGQGNIVHQDSIFKDQNTSLVDFVNHSYYVFTADAVYDYSKKDIQPEKMATVINEDNKMEPEEWDNAFKQLYKKAEVVIYEDDRYTYDKCSCNPVYFKIADKWTLMYTDPNQHDLTLKNIDMHNSIGRAELQGYPAKFNGLIVLRDNDRKMFSDMQNTDDAFLATYYTVHMNEQKLDYKSDDKLENLFFRKEIVDNEAAYTDIPLSFGGIAYYKLTIGHEDIFLKENASKESGLAGKLESNMYLFELPEKFRSKTAVRFLDFRSISNVYQSGSEGLYIIRKKHNK